MFSTTADRQLVARSSMGSLQGQCGQFRPLLPGQHVHAGRRTSSHKRPGSIAAAPFPTPSALGSGPAGVFEEDIEAIAVLERPGAVPSTLFHQHDQAMQQLQELQAFNSELSSAIADADLVLEKAEWNTLVLPPIIKNKWTSTYREGRKKEERQSKEARRKRAELREQQRAERAQQAQQASAAILEQPAAAAPLEQQQQPSPAQHQQQPMPDSIPAAAAPPSSSSSSEAAAPRQRTREAAQPAVSLQQQQQAPVPRTRRSRSSAVAPAAVPRSVINSLSALPGSSSSSDTRQAAAALSAGFEQAAPSQPSPQSAAPAAAAPTPVAPTPGRTGSRGTHAARTAAAAAASSSTSTELAVSSKPAPEQQAAASSSFAPLSVLQARPLGAPAATSRRVQRAAGIQRRGGSSSSTTGGATAALANAPSWSAKSLADNTLHGLDMRAELLTGDQEKELAVMVQDLLALEGVARDLAVKLGRTPSDVEWMEAAEAHGDSPDLQAALAGFHARLHAGRNAKQVMIKANYKLVVSICRKYQGAGMNMGDLINEGISGLVKGVERFEPAKGFKFSTYAHWWIRQAVSRSLADQGRLVRLPIHMQELLSKASKASKAFEAKHGREPTPEELAPELGVEASRIKDAWDAVSTPRSLDQPMGADADGGTLGDVVEDDRTIGSEQAVYIESLKQDLEGVLAGLSERDAGVLRMRFGLLDGREYTLDEVGAEFKVTRERIRQIEAKAIRELRAHHVNPGSVMADYQHGPMADKQLASRTSSGTKKQK